MVDPDLIRPSLLLLNDLDLLDPEPLLEVPHARGLLPRGHPRHGVQQPGQRATQALGHFGYSKLTVLQLLSLFHINRRLSFQRYPLQ